MATKMPIPAKALLKTKLGKITPVELSSLIDDLGRDVGRIESLIVALTQYKEDVFSNGLANLAIWMTVWADIADKRNEPMLVAWSFRDQLRPRTFRLVFHTDGTYSATGDERLGTDTTIPTKIDMTDEMTDQLKRRIPAQDMEKAAGLLTEWRTISHKPLGP
jgi:hypothetical protein